MLFEDNDISIIDASVDYSALKQFASKRGLPYYDEDISSKWNAYAQWFGSMNGLTWSEQLSFGYIVSSLFGGVGQSCSTEMYYREEQITHKIVEEFNRLKDLNQSDEEIMKELFNFTFRLYSEDIEDYTFKTEKMNMKLSLSMMEHFLEIDGETKTDKFRNLVKNYKKE